MEVCVIEVNGERYVNLTQAMQAVAAIREHSTSRREALEFIVKNLKSFSEQELTKTLEVKS